MAPSLSAPRVLTPRNMKPFIRIACGAWAFFLGVAGSGDVLGKGKPMSFFELATESIDHKPTQLSAWQGKVALVVNTASACGSTPQYAGLETLWKEYESKGLVVLGFPSNDFGGQEPGTEAEIKTFCSTNYHVTFPMFAKVKTKGPDKSPVYRFLTETLGEPKWNFHKYLVGKDGKVIRAFDTRVQPDDSQLRAAIDEALKAH